MLAKRRMVESNLRLVCRSRRTPRTGPGHPWDLIQEGILGLIRAIENFDWRRLQVLDLRDLVDPPGGGPCAGRQAAPSACPCTWSSGCRRSTGAERTLMLRAGPRADERGGSPRGPSCRSSRCASCARRRGSSIVARRAPSASPASRPCRRCSPTTRPIAGRTRSTARRTGSNTLSAGARRASRRRRACSSCATAWTRCARTLDDIARELGLTRERVRQIEVETLGQLAAVRELQDLRDRAA